jgi:hypothetical protein
LANPFFPLAAKIIQGRLDMRLLPFHLDGICVPWNNDGRGNEDCGAGKGVRNLMMVPTFFKNVGITEGDVKTENGSSGCARKQHCPAFGDEARTARAINGKGRIRASSQATNHFHEGAGSAARTRSPRRAVTLPQDYPSDDFAIEILAGHDHDAALSPKPGRGKNLAVPEGIDQPLPHLARRLPVFPAKDFPA